MSIHEEIEGRTAVTLMSKPVTRRAVPARQVLSAFCSPLAHDAVSRRGASTIALWIKPYFDRLEDAIDPVSVQLEHSIGPRLARLGMRSGRHVVLFGVGRRLGVTAANSLCLRSASASDGAPGRGGVFGDAGADGRQSRLVPAALLPRATSPIRCRGDGSDCGRRAGSPRISRTSSRNSWTRSSRSLSFFSNVAGSHPRVDAGYLVPSLYTSVQSSATRLLYTAIALLFGLILFEDRDLA